MSVERRPGRAAALAFIFAALFVAAEIPVVAQTNQGEQLLFLADGGIMHGAVTQTDPASGVAWRHEASAETLLFKPERISQITFPRFEAAKGSPKPTALFRFWNGDQILGTLKSLDDESAEIESFFGNGLRAARSSLQSIAFDWRGYTLLYEGPTSADGWQMGAAARGWRYEKGTLTTQTQGVMGREFKLSGSSTFSFDLGWAGGFRLTMLLYTPSFDRLDYAQESYEFQMTGDGAGSPGLINARHVRGAPKAPSAPSRAGAPGLLIQGVNIPAGVGTLSSLHGTMGTNNSDYATIPEMAALNGKVRLDILTDFRNRTVSLMVNHKLAQRWRDDLPFEPSGGGAVFLDAMGGPTLSIGNVEAADWIAPISEGDIEGPTNKDEIYFVNHDELRGTLNWARDGRLQVSNEAGTLELPMSRVEKINFKLAPPSNPPSHPWHIRADLAGVGTLSLVVQEWTPTRLSGTSDLFGPISFDSSPLRAVDFLSGQRATDFFNLPAILDLESRVTHYAIPTR